MSYRESLTKVCAFDQAEIVCVAYSQLGVNDYSMSTSLAVLGLDQGHGNQGSLASYPDWQGRHRCGPM